MWVMQSREEQYSACSENEYCCGILMRVCGQAGQCGAVQCKTGMGTEEQEGGKSGQSAAHDCT